jgi:hypothetical protein
MRSFIQFFTKRHGYPSDNWEYRAVYRATEEHSELQSFEDIGAGDGVFLSRLGPEGDSTLGVTSNFILPRSHVGNYAAAYASFPSGRTRELYLDFFAAVATLNSLRDANLWGRGSVLEQYCS